MKNRRVLGAVGAVATVALVAAAGYQANQAEQGAGVDVRARLTVVAPAAAGGGWDLVARTTQAVLRDNSIVANARVDNIPGAGGTIGLSQFVRYEGDPTTLLVTGTVMLGGITISPSGIDLTQTTPIARLAEDFEVIAVPADSEYEDLEDFVAAWQADTDMPIGGGSAGGIDHMVAGQLAREIDIDPGDINYAAYAGGGELRAGLLSTAAGQPEIGISGFNDFRELFESGDLRPLAVVSPEPIEGIDAPTMVELGYDEVDLVNWRGLVAPPGITDDERQELITIVEEMMQTQEWADAVEINRWEESYLAGDEFEAFLGEEQARIDDLLADLGIS